MADRIKPKEQKILQQAQALLSRNDASAAKEILFNFYQKNKPGDYAKYLMSACHTILLEHEKALGPITRLVEAHPDNAEYLKLLGHVQHSMKNHELASVTFRQALAINSTDTQTLSNLASALLETQQHDEAEKYYKQSLTINPNQPDALTNYGLLMQTTGKIDEAISLHQKALSFAPDNFTAYYNLAFALQEKGELENALQTYNRVITAMPNHVRALCDISFLLVKMNRADEAINYLVRAEKLDPENEHVHLNLAIAYTKLEKHELIEASYKKVISLNPANETAKYCLAMIKGENTFDRSPNGYVQELFDGYAETFDLELVDKLEYKIPEQIGDIVKQHANGLHKYKILDLGCGTGLVGSHLKQLSTHMVGVDIAPKMINKTASKNIYDELVVSAIDTYFETHAYRPTLVTSADVFIYIGDIYKIFSDVSKSLEDDGLFIFSIENTDEDSDFMLKKSGRFGHNSNYIESLIRKNNFEIIKIVDTIVRLELNSPIDGKIYFLQKR